MVKINSTQLSGLETPSRCKSESDLKDLSTNIFKGYIITFTKFIMNDDACNKRYSLDYE